ncbi:MAG TPA: Ig-like domain-containing protein [Patescibacteria group bacterium]|nr:Ig-like domain-containing protein [Patescibacteria group bacterium]
MKKTFFLLLIISLGLSVSSCKRSDIVDPDWDSPVGFYVLLEGSADPAVFFIDGNIHRSTIRVRVTDSKGNPLPGETIFFEQLEDSGSSRQLDWGYFENNAVTIKKVTNANGEVSVNFYGPVEFYSGLMFIHALMQVDGRADRGSLSHIGNVPQDYIAIAMYNSGGTTAGISE